MSKKTPKILVVDDTEYIRKVYSRFLERENFEVTFAENGKDALEKMNFRGQVKGLFDLVISDVRMPVMNGYELYLELRKTKKYQDVPFIFMTGYLLFIDNLRQKIEKDSNVRYLLKPADLSDMLPVVQNALRIKAESIN